MLVWNAPTVRINPTIPQSAIDAELNKDLAKNTAEYLAIFRDDIADFVQRAAVMDCVDIGIRERPPQPGKFKYFSVTDPSGGSGGDFMACCIGHMEGGVTVIDALRENFSPFDPYSVADEYKALFRTTTYRRRMATDTRANGLHRRSRSWALHTTTSARHAHRYI